MSHNAHSARARNKKPRQPRPGPRLRGLALRSARATRLNRAGIFERDRWRCQYCGLDLRNVPKARRMELLTLDHIVPRSRGGKHERGNLTTACIPCNQEKAHRTPEEWRAGLPLKYCTGDRPLTKQQIARLVDLAREDAA